MVEDDPLDAELSILQLQAEGFRCDVSLVDNERDFKRLLRDGSFDIVLSDFNLPSFSGAEALALAKAIRPELPFIVVSGVLGEENAVETLKQGATDYVLKQRLQRLPQTVARALREVAERTHRLQIERALQQTETHFRLLVDALQEYAVVTLDTDGIIKTWNHAATSIFGYHEEEVAGQSFELLYTREDRLAGIPQSHLEMALRDGSWNDDRWLWRKDGARFFASGAITAIRDESGVLLGFSNILRDNTERRIDQENTFFLANHDPLTGLANRSNFQERLREALAAVDRDGNQVAVLLLDLDRFKSINDILGHHVGDLLLIEAANRLTDCIRETDTVARLGGDEFVVIQTRVQDLRSVEILAEKINRKIAAPFTLDGNTIRTSSSIGIAIYPDHGRDPGVLLQHADIAMYRTKSAGRNGYRIFSKGMFVEAQLRKNHEDNLRHAIEHQEFELYFQPQIRLDTYELCGAEVLLRARNAVLEKISTDRLIAIAEETGLINPLGEWVLDNACRQVKSWQDMGLPRFKLAVNFSPKQFMAPSFLDATRQVLQNSGLESHYLELEVTEGLLMDANEANTGLMDTIKQLGVQISVDDFGTGFSALSYLKHFPIDVIKLDESLIRNLPHHRHDRAIVTAVIGLARNLNVQVVAEGVETIEQLAYLKAHDCPIAQGFLFGQPMTAQAFEKRLQDNFWKGPAVW